MKKTEIAAAARERTAVSPRERLLAAATSASAPGRSGRRAVRPAASTPALITWRTAAYPLNDTPAIPHTHAVTHATQRPARKASGIRAAAGTVTRSDRTMTSPGRKTSAPSTANTRITAGNGSSSPDETSPRTARPAAGSGRMRSRVAIGTSF